MSFPMGLTDGMGTVVEEDELDDSFVNSIGSSVASQFVITPEAGGNYVPPPAPSFPDEGIAPPPPAPDAGSSYFESDVGFTEYDGGPAYEPLPPVPSGSEFFNPTPQSDFVDSGQDPFFTPYEPEPTYVSDDDFFGSVGSSDPLGIGFTEQGPGDTLNSGFGTWLDTQINAAVRDGDEQKYNDLIALFNQGGEGPPDLYLRGMMDQMGSPILPDYANNPLGTIGFDRADIVGELLPGQAAYDRYAQQQRDFFGLPSFAGQGGDPFAEGTHADYRDFAMSQENLRFNTSADPTFGLGKAFAGFGTEDIVPGLTLREALGAAWNGYNYVVQKAGLGLNYAEESTTYAYARLAGLEADPNDRHAERPLPGEDYVAFLRRQYNKESGQRLLYETIGDPTNVIGAGTIGRLADTATIAQKGKVVRRSAQEFIESGLIPTQLVDDFLATKPSWRAVNELDYVSNTVTRALTSQTNIPVDDIANQALARRLAMEWHLSGQQGGDIAQTTQRVIAEISWDIERRYGKRTANQVVRQLNTPSVQQAAQVIANPNAIPLPNGQIVVVEGNTITGIYAPGSGRNVVPSNGGPVRLTGTSYQRTNTPALTYTFAPGSGRNTFPTGLTRRNDGSIVTVSRKTAEDVLETAQNAETAISDVRVMQQPLIIPTTPNVPTVASTLPDPVLDDLLPPAPVRQAVVPVDASVEQMRWLDLFSRRDGINYVDEIVTAGDTSRMAVLNKLQEIDNGGMATAAQLLELSRLGAPPSRRVELAKLSRQQADAEIARLARNQPRPDTQMTMAQYKDLYPDVAAAPYSDDMVIRALKRGKAYGIDYLRRALDEGWSRTQFYDALQDTNLPATPAQRRRVEQMLREGRIKQPVDLDNLTTAKANDLIGMNRMNPVEAQVKHNVTAPLEVIDEADVAAQRAAEQVIEAKKKAQDYLRRHLPQFTTTQYTPPGFKKAIATQPKTDLGVSVMSPLAFRQWAIDRLVDGTFVGTEFEPILDELSQAIIHVGSTGLLSDSTVSAHFEWLTKQVAEIAGTAEPDDVIRFVDALDNAYGNDRYREITEMAGRRVKGVGAEELARRVDMARRQLPTIEADLADIRRQLNDPTIRSGLTRQEVDRLRAERGKLEEQQKRALDLTNPKGHTAPAVETPKAKREAAKQASSEKARAYAPNLGERPVAESDQSLAGLMSDHDVQHQLVNGLVSAVDQEVVVGAGGGVPAFRNQPAGRLPAEPPTNNYRVPLSQYTDRLYHETSAMEASFLVEGTNPQMEIWFSNDPSIALGQSGKGVLVEFAPDDIMGQINRSKPTWEYSWREAGTAEFYTPGVTMAGTLQRNIRSVTIAGDVEHSRSTLARLRGQLQRRGWVETKLTDGSSRYTPPTASSDIAAGGGAGIIHPSTARLMPRLKVPTIEPNLAAWRNADWDAVGPHLDAYADQFYNVDWLLDQDKRITLGGKDLNPTALQDSAKVALAGDFSAAAIGKHADAAMQTDDPYGYMRNLLENWVANGSTDRLFQSSRHGAETMRLIRQAGKDVLDDWDAVLPPGDVVDVPRLADRMGTRIAESYAKSIDFNPDNVPDHARVMMWVKAQMTPLWMTTVPAYHINNIAGNFMAMVIETLRGRGNTNMFRGIVNGNYFDKADTGFSWGRWVNMDMSQFTETAVSASTKNAQGRHRPALLAIPGSVRKHRVRGEGKGSVWIQGEGKDNIRILGNTASIIDWATGGNLGVGKWKGLATAGEDFGNTAETLFKKAIYSQEVWGEYPKLWRAELDQMMKNGDISPQQLDKMVMAKGLKEVRETALTNGLDAKLDDLLARQRAVIFNAEHRAYTIAADAMRDYRMRNKIDGLMDQFLPVHFWATKNMLYVTKAAMDRPALAVSAGQAYNALAAEHKDDPLSIATGYVKATADMIPFLPEGSDYYLRLTQLTNPIFFALPKLVNAMNRDYQNRPEDSSFLDMAKHWGKNGLANFWEASGYRLGPQWDWAIKAANRLNQHPDGLDADIMFAANFITAPYTDREGKRRPGQQAVVPFGGWESLLRKVDVTVGGVNVNVNDGMKWLNELATGSPYTNYEVAQAALWMKEDTFVNWTPENQLRLETALAAMGQGNYDDPYVQQAMGRVFDNSAMGFVRGRLLGFSGREQTVTNQKVADAWAYYETAKKAGEKDAATDPSILWQLPAELRWIIRDSGASQKEIDAAMRAAGEGNDHALLKKAREATGNETWAQADQQEFGRLIFGWGTVYDRLVEQYGTEYAMDKVFGTYNRTTGQREGGLAPGMEALFMATSPERMFVDANQNIQNRNANALEDMYWNQRMEESHAARPYFDKIAKAGEALQSQVAKAGDNMYLVDLAYRSHANITGKIYDEAKANGIDMGPSGDPPSQGKNYYTRTQDERNFLEWNGALEAVEGRERQQARQGYVLNLVVEQLGVKKYGDDGELNPDFVTDGKFDEEKYNAAVEAASQQAPALFHDIVLDIRGTTNSRIEMGVDGKGITPQDFIYHLGSENPRLDAWREQRQADRSAFFEMENGPEKDAERTRLLREYGEEFLDRTYKDTPDGTTAGDHRRHTEGMNAVADWFYTLSPKDKDAFEEQYPDAFEKVEATNAEGDTYMQNKLFPDRLTGDQISEIVQSNGLDTSLVRGDRADRVEQLRGAPDEQQRRMDADLTIQKRTEYYDSTTPEDELVLDMYEQLKSDPRYAEAQELKNSSLTKKGFPSWQLAYNKAEAAGDTEMMALIEQQRELGPQVGAIYDKRDEWFNALPDDVKAVLIENDPATFGRYADGGSDPAGTPVSGGGESSTATATTTGAGGSGRPWIDYGNKPSSYVPRGGGSSSRGGGSSFSGGSGAGGADSPVLNQILSLDPFLATGEDDGRRAIAMQVSDHVSRIVSAFSMFTPDKRMAQFFTGMWMQLIGRMLGPNPDINSWMALLARLTKSGQPQQPPQGPQGPPAPPVEPVGPPAADSGPQARSTLGAY